MNNLFLTTDQAAFERYQNQIITYSEIYTTASKELVNLDVKGYKAENLINGNFLVIFHEYHKNEHAQPQWANLGISYENLDQLDKAKENYEKALNLNPDHKKAEMNLKRVISKINE
jgi:tetratricopeptide (TPR) repeat protein